MTNISESEKVKKKQKKQILINKKPENRKCIKYS